jgi:hypothetical protein
VTRKHISWEKKCAVLTRQLLDIPYDHSKAMTVSQINSLVQFDHNILHETGHKDRDEHWNFTARRIREHREKTKQDAKIIAKSRRNRRKRTAHERRWDESVRTELFPGLAAVSGRRRKIPQRVNPWPPRGSRKLRSDRRGKKCLA